MVKKFGEYLIKRGVIDASTLVEALHRQSKNNVINIGETAVRNKALTPEQFLDILSVNETIDERFEDIALLLNYLTQDEIDDLRAKQEKEQQFIGEILVALGKLTQPQLEQLLQEFNKQLNN